jgi:PilZ domain
MSTMFATNLARPLRRSTRVNKSVPITVVGIDSYRAPYREDVRTLDVSYHGCRFESKHDLRPNSWVKLELPTKENNGDAVSARGLVKWVKQSQNAADVYQTAIELADPGNIWGIDAPPQDWLMKRPANLFVGQIYDQMEKILFDAADAAVRQRAGSALEEVRHGLREEAKRILEEVAGSHTGPWINLSLKQLNDASLESAKTLHAAWAKRLEADTRKVMDRIEERNREFDILAQSLSANALDRLQRDLKSSREEAFDSAVARLEEQSNSLLDQAKQTMAQLAAKREEFQTALDQSLRKSTARIEEACSGFQGQFEMIIRERLDAAREDLEGAIRSSTSEALESFAASSQQQQVEAQSRLHDALEPIAQSALHDLQEKATSSSRELAREMSDRSRTHLEFVSNSIAEAAKALSRPPGE